MFDPVCKFFRRKTFHKLIRIFVGAHVDDLYLNIRLFQHRNGTQCCFYPCLVTVIAQIDKIGIPLQQAAVLAGKGSSQGCHGIGKSSLMKGNYIHIAFADDHAFFLLSSDKIQSIQVSAFVKYRRFR